MVEPRPPITTVSFIDDYCKHYQKLFSDVRNFEAFKFLHIGMISELPRKSLPAIARSVGLLNAQSLHHFLQRTPWQVEQLRARRLELIKQLVGRRSIILCIDETGDKKAGKTTDYVAKQYIGNLGKTDNGIVSVNAYAVVDNITYPLLFKIFKPRCRLQPGDVYKTKPELAVEILQELEKWKFQIELVLADSLYGESGDVIRELERLKLRFIVAIRSNHSVLIAPGQKVRYNRWRAYTQVLSHHPPETRYIREIVFGKVRTLRYYEISKTNSPTTNPLDTWFIMTNLPKSGQLELGKRYSLRGWIEYGFKQVKNELGWADFRVTDYSSIERWWEIVLSAYLLISWHANQFQNLNRTHTSHTTSTATSTIPFEKHPYWEAGTNWKSALNNLRLLIQPFIFWCLLQPWLQVFPIPGLKRGFFKLMACLNDFRTAPITYAQLNSA
jgi:SRSO17 transposase